MKTLIALVVLMSCCKQPSKTTFDPIISGGKILPSDTVVTPVKHYHKSDGKQYTSDPPQYRCVDCGQYYRDFWD